MILYYDEGGRRWCVNALPLTDWIRLREERSDVAIHTIVYRPTHVESGKCGLPRRLRTARKDGSL